ncbi:MAG: hypothetical protein HYZ23_10090, partial [Chloroflexi bacterium]|nr:hypothetical protein [Chloroflexota bacterium]
DCKAPSSITVENKIGEWLPLTIDKTYQLDAATASAISPLTTTYYPPDEAFKKYREIATTVTLQIKDKATGSVVKTASQNLMIYSGTTKSANFSWTPSEPSYKAGKYTVILTTHVTDPKCSSVIDDFKQQDIEVFPKLPDDACVIKAYPTTLRTAISRGQQGLLDIPAYYYHMKKEYNASYAMHLHYKGITANYKMTFTNKTNKVDKILTGSFPKSFTGERVDIAPAKPTNTVAWTPLSSGNYNVRLEMTSTDALCSGKVNDFSQGTRTDTVNVLAKDVDGDGYKDAQVLRTARGPLFSYGNVHVALKREINLALPLINPLTK